jgi:cytochrome c-type biogenesis protein CcmH
MTFWIIAAAMVIATLAFVLPPLLRRPRITGPDENELNVVVHRQRLAELEADLRNDTITQAQFEAARAELERQLLADVPQQDRSPAVTTASPARWPAATVAVLVPLVAVGLYLKLGNPDALRQSPHATAKSPEMHSLEEGVSRLAARLSANPNDAEGWMMLGRSYIVLQRFGEATLAYAKAYELLGNQPDIMVDYAEALALANNNSMAGKPAELVMKAIKQDPKHAKGLWLAGHAAAQQNRLPEAIGYWKRLLAMLPPGQEGARNVSQVIAQAEGMLGKTSSAPPTPTAAPAGKVTVQVRVALAPALAARAAPTDTVFVFARAAQGPRMPLAIVRKQVKDLPTTVTLDDSTAMSPQMTISSVPEVVIGARVSKTGNASASSGDMQGLTQPLKTGSLSKVELTVSEVLP